MDEKKQIEEMAELICDSNNDGICVTDGCICNHNCDYRNSASVLYGEGYRKQSGWVSVDERLPEDGLPVVVCLKSGGITIARYDMAWGRFRTSGSITITHWMPLPEPPKGE